MDGAAQTDSGASQAEVTGFPSVGRSTSDSRLTTGLQRTVGVVAVAEAEAAAAGFGRRLGAAGQGLTLVHFSAQLEPYPSQQNTVRTLNTPLTWAAQTLRAPPIPYKALKLS